MVKFSILSVDDEEYTQALIKEILSEEHVVSLVSSGEDCLNYINTKIPDLILLDVSMPPGINGFETCKKIKKNELFQNVPVIFISGQSSEAERLEGYESGGVDYILKPFEIDNLRERVNLNLELARQNKNNSKLEKSLKDSNQSAIHALNYSNDLSLVIQYYEQCHEFGSADAIARKILSITTELGLRAVVQIRVNGESEEFSDFGVVTPLERQVIFEKHEAGLFYQMHGHLMVNHSNVSILIKNMPTQADAIQEINYEKLQETLRALNYAANKSVLRLSESCVVSKKITSSNDSDIVDVMILKLQNICDDYQINTLAILNEIIESIELVKQDDKSRLIQKELYKIIKTIKEESKNIKDKKLDSDSIKKEIANLLEMISN